jgi:hypothetical protein
MVTTTERRAATSLTPPEEPRLQLQRDRSASTLLDGGWWPSSTDPATQLPGLVLALDGRYGPFNPITRVMLGTTGWDPRPHRLRVDGLDRSRRLVWLGWFPAMPAGLLIATYADGRRTDLLTVPPQASEQAAEAAMEQAAQGGNRSHAPALMAALAAVHVPAAAAAGYRDVAISGFVSSC